MTVTFIVFFVTMKENMGLFKEYKNQPDPFVRERASNWAITIGLQRVDGLNVSEFLIRVAILFPALFLQKIHTLSL